MKARVRTGLQSMLSQCLDICIYTDATSSSFGPHERVFFLAESSMVLAPQLGDEFITTSSHLTLDRSHPVHGRGASVMSTLQRLALFAASTSVMVVVSA